MKSLVLSLALALLFASSLFAQPGPIMGNIVQFDDEYVQSKDVAAYEDGSALQVYALGAHRRLWLRMINADGDLVWERQFAELEEPLAVQSARIIPLENGGAFFAFTFNNLRNWQADARKLFVYKLDADGETDWVWESGDNLWPPQERYVADIKVLDEFTVAVAGFCERPSQPDTGFLMKFNRWTGEPLSTVFMDADFYLREMDAYITEEYVAMCAYTGGWSFSHTVAVFNHTGALVQESEISDHVMSICQGTDGAIYALASRNVSRFRIICIDPGGEVRWRRGFEWPSYSGRASITTWRDNLLFVRFNTGDVGLFSGGGDSLWVGPLVNANSTERHPVTFYPNGDVLIGYSHAGNRWDPPYTSDLGLLRFPPPDAWYAAVEDDDFAAEPVREFRLLPAYPNPFNASTTLQLELPVAGEVGVTVVDMLGRRVDGWTVPVNSPGMTPVSWTPDKLASGVYLLRVTGPGGVNAAQKVTLVR